VADAIVADCSSVVGGPVGADVDNVVEVVEVVEVYGVAALGLQIVECDSLGRAPSTA
jgi:hypothetical protein